MTRWYGGGVLDKSLNKPLLKALVMTLLKSLNKSFLKSFLKACLFYPPLPYAMPLPETLILSLMGT
jgi:hypothetical protein